MALTAAERETIITWTDDDERIQVSTSQRKIVTQILANSQAEILEDRVFDGTRMLIATLPIGGVTIRKKAAGTIKRQGTKRQGMPSNAARCGEIKANGEPCKSLASKATGKCAKHSEKK